MVGNKNDIPSHTFVESKVKPKAHEIVVFKRKSNQMHIWRLRSNCEINFCNAFVSSLFVEKREMKFKHKTRSPIYFSSPLENLAKVFLLELYTNNKLNKQESDCKHEIFTRSGAGAPHQPGQPGLEPRHFLKFTK